MTDDDLSETHAVFEAEAAMLREQNAAREVSVGKLLGEVDSERLNELLDTTDAKEWAREFRRVAAAQGIAVDWGWMIGWFASAIETGRTAGAAKERERLNAMIDAGTADGRDLVERLVAAKEERDGAEKDAADMAKRLGAMDSELHQARRDLAREEHRTAGQSRQIRSLMDDIDDLRSDLRNETARAERAEATREQLRTRLLVRLEEAGEIEPGEEARQRVADLLARQAAWEAENLPAEPAAEDARKNRNVIPVTPLLGVYYGHLTVNAEWRGASVDVALSGPMDTVEAVMAAAIDSLRNEAEK
jgi:chromosome segregation ATPase